MRADGVASGRNLLEQARLVGRMQADREEDRLGAMVRKRGQHGGGVARPRAIVEGQYDFAFAQEVVALEVLEAEARAAGSVDFHHAGDAKRVRIARAVHRGRRRRRRCGSGCRLRENHRLRFSRRLGLDRR